jgi:hypothetical protein
MHIYSICMKPSSTILIVWSPPKLIECHNLLRSLLTFQLVVGVGTRVQDHLEEYVQAGDELIITISWQTGHIPMLPSLWQKECKVQLLFQVFEKLTFHRTKFSWANKVDKLCQMTVNQLPRRQQAVIWWKNLSRSRETRRRPLRGKFYHSWVIWLYNQQVHPHIPPLIWASSSLHHIQKSSSIHVSPLSTR